VTGWTVGPHLVAVGAALAAMLACYFCARELGVSPLPAMIGAAAIVVNPMHMFIAIQPLSDAVAMTWCVVAAYFALRARRAEGYGWSIACGLACTVAVLVRPTNILVLPAIALLLWRWRPLLVVALAGIPGAIALLSYQKYLYGNALTSGYGSIFEIFEAANFGPTMKHYAEWLPRLLCPAFLLLAVVSVIRWREHGRVLLALWYWAGVVILFYAYYVVTKEAWWCLRFILPAYPAIVLAGLLGLEPLLRKSRVAHAVGVGALALWVGISSVYWGREQHVHGPSKGERTYILAGEWARDHLPRNAAVCSMVASGALFFYTDLAILRWDTISADDFKTYALALQKSGRPLYALLMDLEEPEAFKDHLVGKWEKIADVKTARVWKWTAPP
jgi:hypothetical protein